MTRHHSIGEFSRLTGLTEKALRLYGDRGLLEPAEVDPSTGYRRYAPDQVEDGRMIALLRAVDMPLAVIDEVMARPPGDRSAAVGAYWYRVERELDDRREAVRTARELSRQAAAARSGDTVDSGGGTDGAFGVVAALATARDPLEAAPAYVSAMRAAYWDDADLTGAVVIGLAGIGRLLAEAERADESAATELRSTVKGLLYDVASFTWPGWDAPGIAISTAEAELGVAAARANLVMAHQLGKDELARSRARWLLGVHLLASGSPEAAGVELEAAATLADDAGARPEALLAEAFGSLARLAAGDVGAEQDLQAVLGELAALDDGAMFAEQLTTARTVLGL